MDVKREVVGHGLLWAVAEGDFEPPIDAYRCDDDIRCSRELGHESGAECCGIKIV